MKQELDLDYDINAANMLDITEEVGDFKIALAEFNGSGEDMVNEYKKVLVNNQLQYTNQIFQMNDGKFILEVDNGFDIEYFYSNDINDLI